MVKRGTNLPDKLNSDAIVEAILEIRFEGIAIPEIFYGRMADKEPWKHYTQRRLPGYEIPPQARMMDPSFRYTPVIELIGPDGTSALRIGPYAISYHRTPPYVGWQLFRPELEQVVDSLFSTAPAKLLIVERLGLRYLNSLTQEAHGINSIADLDIKLTDSDGDISTKVNINFSTSDVTDTSCTVRIATREFIQGNIPPNTTVFVDVDVFSNEGFKTSDIDRVKSWVNEAHEYEKNEFFHLLTQSTITKLMEKK